MLLNWKENLLCSQCRQDREYMCVNDRKAGGKVKLEEFKYVSAIQSNEQCTREVKRVQGVERVEMSVGVVRPAMMYD